MIRRLMKWLIGPALEPTLVEIVGLAPGERPQLIIHYGSVVRTTWPLADEQAVDLRKLRHDMCPHREREGN